MKEENDENAKQPRALLAGRLLALIELHRQALRGLVDITIEEFVAMQKEMSDIRFELGEN